MPQIPFGSYVARKLATTALAPLFLDATSKALMMTAGGNLSSLNLGAAAAIQVGACRANRIIIIAPGSGSGTFTFNDCAATGDAAAANAIFVLNYNATANVAGQIFTLDWPCAVGLTLSAVPGSGSPLVAVSYTF